MHEPETSPAAALGPGGAREREVESLIAAVQADVDARLEDGLHAIQRTATTLMREIASEVWRTAGGDKDEIRETILEDLSREEAIRGVVALADERFQALAARTARLEESIDAIADSVRATNDRLADGVKMLAKVGAGAGGGQDATVLREQLATVTREVSSALAMLAERDQAIVDTVQARVREHGELITHETARISGAMQSYVQHGVQAIGQLAGTMEAQLAALAERDDGIVERVVEAFAEQMRALAEQLQLMYERLAIDTTSVTEAITHFGERTEERTRAVGEYLHLLNDRVALGQRETMADVHRTVDARVMGLARMVRSDAEALRRELVRVAAERDEHLGDALDERLAHVSDAVAATTTTIVDDLAGRMREEMADAVRARIDDAVTRLEARSEELTSLFQTRSDDLATRLEERSDEVVARFEARAREQAGALETRIGETVDGLDKRLDLVRISVDDRIAALARLVRSDNETLAQQIVADQDSSKQALRAMKELQASLPGEVIDMVEQRFASLAESIERSNEMLAKRIDRMADTIGERHDNEIQVVIDRMGDAMHALANLGRPTDVAAPRTAVADPRLELD
jgi:DNA anti-recombination protein RmuC